MAPKTSNLAAERREYLRLDSVFPVQFCLLGSDGATPGSGWIQGFTNNVGKGGMCLEVNNLAPDIAGLLKTGQAKFSLSIELPFVSAPMNALAKISWVQEAVGRTGKYLIGLSYEQIDPAQNKKIMNYAWARKLFAPVVLTVIFILGAAFVVNAYLNVNLIQGNRALVEQLVKILQETSVAKQKIKEIDREKDDLRLKIQTLQLRIQALDEEREKRKEEANTIVTLNSRIDALSQEKSTLQEQLISLQHKESTVTEQLLRLDQKKTTLAQVNLDKMYQWLQMMQSQRTGLVKSFEGQGELSDWAFTYDQSLAVQAYANFSDFERARKILDFFDKKAQRKGLFFNAYNVTSGKPTEETAYSGPTVWVGIAIAQYTHKSQDSRYLRLAQDIADAIIALQGEDGGIAGGNDVTWRLTEHNLDAYAFLEMLHALTGKEKYLQAKDKILQWLATHINNKTDDVALRRKRGDSTIVANSHLWAVVALGPEQLERMGINPDRILEFAEQNFLVEVTYTRPEGQTIKIKGFDFDPPRHAARGGIAFPEWTAQVVIASQMMADFYFKKAMIAKARSYELKADEYLSQLCNMIISSPSPSGQGESCVPAATHDYVDAGHGWTTPGGKSMGSVAATAYTLFAYYKYSPLVLTKDRP
ncbi:MAG TPA: hypothetical protein VMD52_04690 [Patescibacteria group bacterium]|nr:hypothetical protein [Patescibacteria group bacterium]